MAAEDYVRLYRQALDEGWNRDRLNRETSSVAKRSPMYAKAEQLKAIYELPLDVRWSLFEFLAGRLDPLSEARRRFVTLLSRRAEQGR